MADYQNNRGGNNGATEDKRPKAPIDWSKLSLSTPVEGVQGAWSSFNFDIIGSNVRMTVWTNDPQDKDNDNGKISTSLPMPVFYAFLAVFDQVLKSRGEAKKVVEGLNWFGYGGKRQETPRVEAQLFIGKDADGVMYILMTAPKRPNIVFHFETRDSQKFQFRNQEGNILSKAEVSTMYAKAYYDILSQIYQLDMLSQILKLLEPDKYKPAPTPKWQQGKGGTAGGSGGGGNNYQRNNNNGGGNNNRSNYSNGGGNSGGGSTAPAPSRAQVTTEDYDDEIPY